MSDLMLTVLDEIAVERRRQVEVEGWTPEHDDAHWRLGHMAFAAACYATHAGDVPCETPRQWPWESKWWKPTTRRRDLIKAGALIVAEIERLDRIKS